MNTRTIIGLLITLGVAGCDAAPPYFELPVGHPGHPYTRPAAPIAIPSSLEHEIEDVQPELGKKTENPRPAGSGSADSPHHNHHER